jgi:hypothetical protein
MLSPLSSGTLLQPLSRRVWARRMISFLNEIQCCLSFSSLRLEMEAESSALVLPPV